MFTIFALTFTGTPYAFHLAKVTGIGGGGKAFGFALFTKFFKLVVAV